MISISLISDAAIGNLQEKTIKQHNVSNSEVFFCLLQYTFHAPFNFFLQIVLYSYSVGFVYLFFLVAVFTDIASAIHFCWYYPKQTYGYAFLFSLTGYLGIQVNNSFGICQRIQNMPRTEIVCWPERPISNINLSV